MTIAISTFKKLGVIRTGHFRLHSGWHTAEFWDLERAFSDYEFSKKLAHAAAELCAPWEFDTLAGIGRGGGMFAAALAAPYGFHLPFYLMTEVGGSLLIHRGRPMTGKRLLVVDDVVTTGASLTSAVRAVREAGGEIAGCLLVLDRSEGVALDCPLVAIIKKTILAWRPETCPLCKGGQPFTVK